MTSKKSIVKAVCATPKTAYRLEVDGRAIGMAIALTNGLWVLCDLEENRISKASYETPKRIAMAAQNLGMHT